MTPCPVTTVPNKQKHEWQDIIFKTKLLGTSHIKDQTLNKKKYCKHFKWKPKGFTFHCWISSQRVSTSHRASQKSYWLHPKRKASHSPEEELHSSKKELRGPGLMSFQTPFLRKKEHTELRHGYSKHCWPEGFDLQGKSGIPHMTDVLWPFLCGSNKYSPGREVLSQGWPNPIGLQLPKHVGMKLGICD